MIFKPVFWLVTTATLASSTALAETYTVPGEYATIQAAIDAAQAGDEVLVGPGVYSGMIEFKEAHVTVRSSDGPETTILDGSYGQPYALALFYWNASGTLQGFTCRNYDHSYSGSVTIKNANASIIDCIFEDNQSGWTGSGVRIEIWTGDDSGLVEVRDCTFRRNQSTMHGGALSALVLDEASLLISNCLFEENASTSGGHLSINVGGGSIGSAVVDACTFRNGQGDVPGAFIVNEGIGPDGERAVSFNACTFEQHDGEGIQVEGEVALDLTGCTFIDTGNPAVRCVQPAHAQISDTSFCGATDLWGEWTDLGGNTFEDTCACPGDGTGDGLVDINDLLHLLAAFGSDNDTWDFDGNGTVDVGDVLTLIAAWGPC